VASRAQYTTVADAKRRVFALQVKFARHAKVCAACRHLPGQPRGYCDDGWSIALDLAHGASEVRRLADQASRQQDTLF
jgi:hypothetical protein